MTNSNIQQNKEIERGDCQSVIEKTIAEMRSRPNIKTTIKKGLPRIIDQLEELECAVKTELRTAQQAFMLSTPAGKE